MSIPSISDSNELIKNLIDKNEPFFISRLGGSIGILTWNYKANMQIPKNIIIQSQTHDGIYCNNMDDLIKFADIYAKSVKNSTSLACFTSLCKQSQDYFLKTYSLKDKEPKNGILFSPALAVMMPTNVEIPVTFKLPSILALPSTSNNSSESVKALSSAVIFTPPCVNPRFLPKDSKASLYLLC